ncbi:MAG: phosphate ABC transporter substrate-binding protein PstS, partial [Acidimicrobiales bacterium]
QQVSSDFASEVKKAGGSATVSYTKTGSSDGKKSLSDQTADFAGSDSPIKDEEKASFGKRTILYFPIVGGPIAMAYKLDGVTDLNLSADNIAAIFQGTITKWDDDAIKKDNPDAKLPSTTITVVHRSDGSGTTSNFTKYVKAAAPDTWKLDAGETVNWPQSSNFQGAEKSTGVTQVVSSTSGAITYADLADAAKANLDVANVGNADGEFIAPTPDAASKALGAAKISDDLTYNPLNAAAKGAYPITSPTWILVDQAQSDAGKAKTLKAYLKYVLTTGQAQAKSLLYAPLPTDLAKKAMDQIDQIKG